METLSANLKNAVTGQYQLATKEIFREAWQKVSGVKLPFWGALGWLLLILMVVGTIGGGLLAVTNYFHLEKIGYAINFISNCINGLISSVLTTSLIFLLIQHIANHKVRAKDLFNFNGVFKRLVFMGLIDFFVKLLLVFLAMLGFFYLNPNTSSSFLMHGAIAFFTALTMYAAFQLSLTWHMAWLLVIEKRLSIWLATKIAFRAINKKLFRNIWLSLVTIVFAVATTLATCGIALIWVAPMVVNINAIWYRQIFGIETIQQI